MTTTPTLNPAVLITAADLLALPAGPSLRVFDCRFDLMRPDAGQEAFLAGHIPGAGYLHLDHDLGAKGDASALCGGRHPLPSMARVAATFGRHGVGPQTTVVLYDAHGGMYAARAWWLLKWLGHGPVLLLDGGLAAWQSAGGALATGPAADVADLGAYPLPAEPGMAWVDAETVQSRIGRADAVLIDARAPERYRGEVEALDPVAGHIPGALNRPFGQNLDASGRFLPAEALRAAFEPLLAGRLPDQVVHQCGSGVTACHNLLAMTLAGLPGSRLYAGSWSEWCSQPQRPIARGAAPG
ncbi:sulfurtransferase [Sphaerotilus mobilis]|uniref:Thiosulfate/3-mercaptopyruvate sulfurtransferase n=1 Tax=Sphaerotilus mobilis TaxID=47994 RepID=A0A4Q7LG71_9BURK|nr:sulfurtransferase [Sphaerotilus mobilis]RZS53031.1 thiosulfate/3-mercaptopyruvate sulfurtransferase [Sphaerotilus mobilis]